MIDLSSVIGLSAAAFLLAVGLVSGQVGAIFLNWHGILIVFGGTAAAMLINTPLRYLRDSFVALVSVLRADPYGDAGRLIPVLTQLAEQVQGKGLSALLAADERAANGFLLTAATTALEYNNPEFVRKVLEAEVNSEVDRFNEVINVIRTAGVLSPMFGLIGTLLGIVQVLKQISDPEKVGLSMAVAITTAFYGILLANLVCVPVAGKLRIRLWEQVKIKAMVIEAVIGMMQGTVPLVLERRLQAFK